MRKLSIWHIHLSSIRIHTGGETGIRTLDGLPHDGFQDRCIQPLCHLSVYMCGHCIRKCFFVKKIIDSFYFLKRSSFLVFILMSWVWNLSISFCITIPYGSHNFLDDWIVLHWIHQRMQTSNKIKILRGGDICLLLYIQYSQFCTCISWGILTQLFSDKNFSYVSL